MMKGTIENRFKTSRTLGGIPMRSDWREQLKNSELPGLMQRLESMPRETLVEWLQWHKPKGNYTDRKCLDNGAPLLSKAKAVEYTYKEILYIHLRKQHNDFPAATGQLLFKN